MKKKSAEIAAAVESPAATAASREAEKAAPAKVEPKSGVSKSSKSPTAKTGGIEAGKAKAGEVEAGGRGEGTSFHAPAEPDWHRRIAEEAYFIASRRNFVGGDALQDWLEAEKSVGKSFDA